MEPAKRVVLNTSFLYGKMLITMFISLFSTRLILNALGVKDFGIFNLVAGVIGTLSFLNAAMAGSTQRYLSYYKGVGEMDIQKKVFSSSVVLHLIIGASVALMLEIAGFFLFDGGLNIPEGRLLTAKIIYQFMIVSTFFTINAVPYDASINAHENMLFDSITGVFESFMKLGIAIWLVYTALDKLILYGVLYAALTIVIRLIKSVYCIRQYEECNIHVRKTFDKKLFKEMLSFSGWNLFGFLSNTVRDQGLAIVLNVFLGVIINAAYGIANQVNGQLHSFSSNINKAMKPQIVQSEGSGDRQRMLRLAMLICKLAFLLFAFFAVPLIIEMSYVLKIWLKNVPAHAVIFCQLILVISLIQQITWGLAIAIQSVGKIREYQIVMGILVLLNLPFAIVLLKMHFAAYSVLAAAIFIEMVAGWARIKFAKKLTGLPEKDFLVKTVLYSVITILTAGIFAFVPQYFMQASFIRLILAGIISSGIMLLLTRYLAFSKEENKKIMELIMSFINSFRKKMGKFNKKLPIEIEA